MNDSTPWGTQLNGPNVCPINLSVCGKPKEFFGPKEVFDVIAGQIINEKNQALNSFTIKILLILKLLL